jgi:hypothetical protein
MPRLAGRAVREYREARQAGRELTALAITAGQSGDVGAGREISGHVDPGHVIAARRKAVVTCAVLGIALAVYGAVLFIRGCGSRSHSDR